MPDAPKAGEGSWEAAVHEAVCVAGCGPTARPPPGTRPGAPSRSQPEGSSFATVTMGIVPLGNQLTAQT